MIFRRIINSLFACSLLWTSTVLSVLYVDFVSRKHILNSVHVVMKDQEIQERVKLFSQRLVNRVLFDPINQDICLSVSLVVVNGDDMNRIIRATTAQLFSEENVDKLSLEICKKFIPMMLEAWTSSEDWENDW